MKHPALFSSKDNSKIIMVSSATILHGYLRVKIGTHLGRALHSKGQNRSCCCLPLKKMVDYIRLRQ